MNFEKRILADGRATLYRGDCLELLRRGVFGKIGAIVSDPPYGIRYQHSGGQRGTGVGYGSNGQYLPSKTDAIIGDDVPFDPTPWIEAAPHSAKHKNHAGVMYGSAPLILLWGADNYMQQLPKGGTLLAWDKHLGRGADDSFADCEWAWSGRKTKREVFRWLWKGIVTKKSALDVATTPTTKHTSGKVFARVHVSQKPVELMRWCIEKIRPLPGLPVLDPYMGSGSTGVAALSLGVPFVGCEIDETHFETACQRIEKAWALMNDGGARPI